MSATPAPPRRASAPRRLGLGARGLVMGVGLLVAATALAGQGRPTELTTASSSFTAVGVIGFGILLVAVVVVGTRVVMRRARGRG
jgi:hypothetical protein